MLFSSYWLIFLLTLLCTVGFVKLKPNVGKSHRNPDSDIYDSSHYTESQHHPEYDHEAFLGREEAKRFDDMTPEESKQKLKLIIEKMDTDHDKVISKSEMSAWITEISNNMLRDDVDRMWREYGLTDSQPLTWQRHLEELFGEDGEYADDDDETKKAVLAKEDRRWKSADDDKDTKLSKEEFFAFAHPEYYSKMRDVIIQETLDEVDKNGDGFIDLEEYINDLWTPSTSAESEPEWVTNERKQFSQRRDLDGDGKLSKSEIGEWIMPKELNHVTAEVEHLFSESDANNDSMLSEDEILNRYDLFVGSQATNFGEILTHDEL